MAEILHSSQTKYLDSFRNEESKIIISMEEFAKANRIPILNWHAAKFIEQIVLMKHPKRVLELGTAIAYTTIRIARLLSGESMIDTIEKSTDNVKTALSYIKKSRLDSKINLLQGEAKEILHKITDKYDLIFLDADKEDYIDLFFTSLPLLKKGGVLIVDNLLWHGYTASKRVPPKFKNSTKCIREFNEIFLSEKKLNCSIYAIGDGLGVGIRR